MKTIFKMTKKNDVEALYLKAINAMTSNDEIYIVCKILKNDYTLFIKNGATRFQMSLSAFVKFVKDKGLEEITNDEEAKILLSGVKW